MLATRMRMAASGVPAGGITTILHDTFTDGNNTLLPDHTPDTDTVGGGYTVLAGTLDIQSNKLNSSASVSVGSIGVGIDGSYTIAAEFITATSLTAHAGLVLRVLNSSNYIVIGNDNGGANFIVGYRTGGGLTVPATTAFAFATSTAYTITATIDAASGITATINGGNQISGTAAVLTGNNTVGMLLRAGGGLDNLLVEG